VVRILEDLVTAEVGLTQQVRSAAKADALHGPGQRHPYPHALDQGQHGFGITALSGANVLARLDGTDAVFVVNLSQLAARTITLGDYASEVPAVQESLF
jgi:hypothetical protein